MQVHRPNRLRLSTLPCITVDLKDTIDILGGQGTVIGAPPGQTVTHSQIAPYLPAFPQRL